jgi:hypothetical protein
MIYVTIKIYIIQAYTGPYRPIQAHTGPYRPIQAHTGPYRPVQALKNRKIAFYNRNGQKYVG